MQWDRDPSINVAIGNGERDLVMRGPETRRRTRSLFAAGHYNMNSGAQAIVQLQVRSEQCVEVEMLKC